VKAKQRNIPKETSGEKKATEYNGQVFHYLAEIKAPEQLKESILPSQIGTFLLMKQRDSKGVNSL
jgi:hypothetical protein